jgi:hypothetical protein
MYIINYTSCMLVIIFVIQIFNCPIKFFTQVHRTLLSLFYSFRLINRYDPWFLQCASVLSFFGLGKCDCLWAISINTARPVRTVK